MMGRVSGGCRSANTEQAHSEALNTAGSMATGNQILLRALV